RTTKTVPSCCATANVAASKKAQITLGNFMKQHLIGASLGIDATFAGNEVVSGVIVTVVTVRTFERTRLGSTRKRICALNLRCFSTLNAESLLASFAF